MKMSAMVCGITFHTVLYLSQALAHSLVHFLKNCLHKYTIFHRCSRKKNKQNLICSIIFLTVQRPHVYGIKVMRTTQYRAVSILLNYIINEIINQRSYNFWYFINQVEFNHFEIINLQPS